MSIAPAKNPVPRQVWNGIKRILAHYDVVIREGDNFTIVDAVGDEIAAIGLLYASSGLSPKPKLNEAELDRSGGRPYTGLIEKGMVFAWEPDLPHARELCLVVKVNGNFVLTQSFPHGKEQYGNDMNRFREAVVPTYFQRMPPNR